MLKPRFSINDAMAGLLCVFGASAAMRTPICMIPVDIN